MWYKESCTFQVLEQNPSKQGLKQYRRFCFRRLREVLEQNPSKQGLKQPKPNSFLEKLFKF